MTIHISYTHQCGTCGAFYLPYDREIPCPQCGAVEQERVDFIQRAADSMRSNHRETGQYTPPAWWIGSLGDHILFLLFQLFDAFEAEPGEDFEQFAADRLAQMDWGNQPYLRSHVEGIAVRLHAELARKPT